MKLQNIESRHLIYINLILTTAIILFLLLDRFGNGGSNHSYSSVTPDSAATSTSENLSTANHLRPVGMMELMSAGIQPNFKILSVNDKKFSSTQEAKAFLRKWNLNKGQAVIVYKDMAGKEHTATLQ